MADAPRISTPIVREMAGAVLNAPAVSSTSVVRLPAGRTYHQVILEMTKTAGAIPTRAEMESSISAIRLVVSGNEVWSLTGYQAIGIEAFYSCVDTTTDGRLIFNYQRLWMLAAANVLEILGPSFGTADQSNFDIEIDWSGTSVIVAAKAYAMIGQVPEPAGKVITMRRVSANIASTGVYQFPDLPLPKPGDYLYAIHIFTPVAANLTRVAYIPDELRMIDVPPGVLNKIYQENHPFRTPQTAKNIITLDFCSRGLGGDAVNLGAVSGHTLELTFANAAPGLVPIVCEIATDIQGIQSNR